MKKKICGILKNDKMISTYYTSKCENKILIDFKGNRYKLTIEKVRKRASKKNLLEDLENELGFMKNNAQNL